MGSPVDPFGLQYHTTTMKAIVIFIATVALCSRAYYAQTLARAADNDTEVCSAGCRVRGSRDSGLTYSNDDVEFGNYQIPENWDQEAVVEALTKGDGWFHLKGVYSAKEVEMAKEKIFEKMAQHPVILNTSNIIIGENSAVSSLAANTVLPGNGGQLPRLDYPYYRMQLPSSNPHIMDNAPPLSLQFVTLLTDFNSENGGTAFRPNSHHKPRYPDNKEEFYKNAIQISGKAGDMILFHGALQHCAMPNRSKSFRTGILQHMAPVYIKPFESMAEYVRDDIKAKASMGLKRLLAMDHPYPMLKL